MGNLGRITGCEDFADQPESVCFDVKIAVESCVERAILARPCA
jgi:hypothetical protein